MRNFLITPPRSPRSGRPHDSLTRISHGPHNPATGGIVPEVMQSSTNSRLRFVNIRIDTPEAVDDLGDGFSGDGSQTGDEKGAPNEKREISEQS